MSSCSLVNHSIIKTTGNNCYKVYFNILKLITCQKTLCKLKRLKNRSDSTLARKSRPFWMSSWQANVCQVANTMNLVEAIKENKNLRDATLKNVSII